MNDLQKDDRDLAVILKEKLAESLKAQREHESKATYHEEEALFHKKRVEYISKYKWL